MIIYTTFAYYTMEMPFQISLFFTNIFIWEAAGGLLTFGDGGWVRSVSGNTQLDSTILWQSH